MAEVTGKIIVLIIVLALVILFFCMVPVGLWISAVASGVKIGIFNLVGMRLRRVKPAKIVMPMIKATKAGMDVKVNQLEAHYLAGGNVDKVVNALIAAERAGMELSFEQASAIDLAGRDVFEAVTMSVTPKVIETPLISAVAKDGIELLVKARVTVRTNIERLIGGAGEATVLARIGEGIVTTVGSSRTHSEVLENPDEISKVVLGKGLDSGTAYEIISIDIADIDIGRNIGANLQSLQAEADNKIAQARAEERRAMAVALEQEMRAAVVEAEAEVPRAMAEALRNGSMGVMDYYRLQNVQADTQMKKEIGKGVDNYTSRKPDNKLGPVSTPEN
ncbi:MAG: flotillin-like protein FloA [Lachnospiraceae bacterium]|nr:flotillin-like protein FloA [Lachnospiraceae bacterium]